MTWLTRSSRQGVAARNEAVAVADEYVLKLDTHLDKDQLVSELRAFEPWGHRIDFSNGVSTRDLRRRTPFSENTLQKLSMVEPHIPFKEFAGGAMLDIGCNSGYNCIESARRFSMKPVGIDVSARHIEVSKFLASMAGVRCEFLLESAETFLRREAFDVALHFGTLYHLKNPLLSLETTCANLKPGGFLALETQVYEHPADDNICYFMHMHNNDKTNFWALSPKVLETCIGLAGFDSITAISRVRPKGLEEGHARIILVARKPR